MEDPIRRTASRRVYEGKLVRIRVDDVVLPKGTETTFEFVEIKPGVCVLPVAENEDVFLIREWKYAVSRQSIECVCGGVEEGELPLNAARRELKEEAGLTASALDEVGTVDPFTSMVYSPTTLFIARGLEVVARDPEEAEVIEVLRMPLAEAAELAVSGRVTHAGSCALILKAARLLM